MQASKRLTRPLSIAATSSTTQQGSQHFCIWLSEQTFLVYISTRSCRSQCEHFATLKPQSFLTQAKLSQECITSSRFTSLLNTRPVRQQHSHLLHDSNTPNTQMGRSQSDQGEKEAYDKVIRYIPVVGFFYSGIRAAVYAGKGDRVEAEWSGKGMVPLYQNFEHDIPALGNYAKDQAVEWAWNKVQDVKEDAKEKVKEKVKEKAGVIVFVAGAIAAAGLGLWYWGTLREAAVERAREDRWRAICREEVERVAIFQHRVAY